ncbi:MAG: M48 family metalloprotease [Hydrogenophilales bacterium]|nr:M48 family metalloprotease [Hydrogenophilales bacterium]
MWRIVPACVEVVARSLDKNAEFEADRMAVVLVSRAGYAPFGLPEELQRIGHFAKDDNQTALLFKTHPHPDDRLARLGDAMDERFDRIKGPPISDAFLPSALNAHTKAD